MKKMVVALLIVQLVLVSLVSVYTTSTAATYTLSQVQSVLNSSTYKTQIVAAGWTVPSPTYSAQFFIQPTTGTYVSITTGLSTIHAALTTLYIPTATTGSAFVHITYGTKIKAIYYANSSKVACTKLTTTETINGIVYSDAKPTYLPTNNAIFQFTSTPTAYTESTIGSYLTTYAAKLYTAGWTKDYYAQFNDDINTRYLGAANAKWFRPIASTTPQVAFPTKILTGNATADKALAILYVPLDNVSEYVTRLIFNNVVADISAETNRAMPRKDDTSIDSSYMLTMGGARSYSR